MPIVAIDMWEGRTVEQKRKLVAGITTVMTETLNITPETIQITIRDYPKHNWAVAGKLATDMAP